MVFEPTPGKIWEGLPTGLPVTIDGPVWLDTETSGLYVDDGARVSCVSVAWLDPEALVEGENLIRYCAWPFAQGKWNKPEQGDQLTLWGENPNLDLKQWTALKKWLSRAGAGLEIHNAKFDLHMMRVGVAGLGGREGKTWGGLDYGADLVNRVIGDTMVTAHELWPTRSAKLKGPGSVYQRLFGIEGDNEAVGLKKHLGPKTNPRYDLVDWEVMIGYSLNDALMLAQASIAMEQLLDRGETAHAVMSARGWIARELELMKVLYRMEVRGVPYDAEGSRQAYAEVSQRQNALQSKLPFDVGTAKEYYFGRTKEGKPVRVPDGRGQTAVGLGLEPYAVTEKKREPQMTAEVVDSMVKDEVEWAAELQSHNKLATANRMWYGPYASGTATDGRLRTCFRQIASGQGSDGGTRSGRFSVERVNLQAIPHDYRLGDFQALAGVVTPRELIAQAAAKLAGWTLYELDLAQAELRVAAMWAGCERMLDAIREGRDLHTETTDALFGLSKGDDGFGAMRQVSKRGNFSLIFGSGWVTFQRMVRVHTGIQLSADEAKRTVYDWRALYPEFGRAIDQHSRSAQARGYVPLANGRNSWFGFGEDYHKAFNKRVQGSLAELNKEWLIRTERVLGGVLDDLGLQRKVGRGGLLLSIHDSQALLVPDRMRVDGSWGTKQTMLARDWADWSRQIAREVWTQFFPGVPGDAEIKVWGGIK